MGEMRTLIERHYRQYGAGDAAAERQLFSDDVVNVDPGAGRIEGIEAYMGYQAAFRTAFPDGRLVMNAIVEGEGTAMVEGTFEGTHTGPMMGPAGEVPATGRWLSLPFADVFVARGGRLVEHRIYYDQMAFLGQLGLLDRPAAPEA
jgi:steroid delta-isomerase-like uncharacterized protein